jgi:hypothetical protein
MSDTTLWNSDFPIFVTEKRCCTCKEVKSADQFGRLRSTKDGLAWRCKDCTNASDRSSYATTKTRAKVIPDKKRCGHCREVKSSDEFARSSGKKDGLSSTCKECVANRKANDVTVNKKRCSTCKRTKMAASFPRCKTSKDGLRPYCNGCRSEKRRIVEKLCVNCKSVKSIDEFETPYAGLCIECSTPKVRATLHRVSNLWSHYRLRQDRYDELLEKQGGACPCGAEVTCVDHDHACCPDKCRSCGRCVRGLLCGPCNRTIGHAQEDPERLIRLVAYLAEYPAKGLVLGSGQRRKRKARGRTSWGRLTEKLCRGCEVVKSIDEFETSYKQFCLDCDTPQRKRRVYHASRLWRNYHITPEQFDMLLEKQGGTCPCGAEATCVDHDHGCCPGERSCGRCVRGLLCGPCNRTIGHAKENPERLINLAAYLGASRVEMLLFALLT